LQQAGQLTDEKRVTAGAGVHGCGGLPGHWEAGDLCHHCTNAGGVETLQPGHRGRRRDATEAAGGIVVPVGAHHQQAACSQLPHRELQQLQRVRVGPVQVIEHDQQPVLRCSLGEVAYHPIEDPEPVRRLACHLGCRRGKVILPAGQASRGSQHLGPRPERRHSFALGATAPCDPNSTSGGFVGETRQQCGLADPRLTGDQPKRPVSRQGHIQRSP
jgi:hypothetical protein